MRKSIRKIITCGLIATAAITLSMIIAAGSDAAGLSDIGVPFSEGCGENEEYSIIPACAGSSCIDAEGNGKPYFQLWTAHRNNNQRWTFKKNGNYYYIKESFSGKVMEIKDGKMAENQDFCLANYNGSDKQLFELDPAGDGTYFIRSKINRAYVMDVYGGNSSNGASIKLFKHHGRTNQRFRFIPLTTPEDMSEWGATRHDCYGKDWDFWDGSYDNSWYYADKNAATYTLKTARQLAGLSQLVRDGVFDFAGRTIFLDNDIDLCGTEWRRIGSGSRYFKGSFNGQGHSIVGLSITTTSSDDGFFGCIDGGTVCNFAIQGSVSGDKNVGGVVGKVESGFIVNVYSEVSITRATDDNEGGITGRLGDRGYIEHCTQNARVNSGDKDPDRGGIVGYCCGIVRYCVNKSSVDCNWDYVGGIVGRCVSNGKVEFCANYGQVSGGGDTERAGGIWSMPSMI